MDSSVKRVDYEGGRVEYWCHIEECQAWCGKPECLVPPPPPDYSEYSTQAAIMLKQIQIDASLGRHAKAWADCLSLARLFITMARSIRRMQK